MRFFLRLGIMLVALAGVSASFGVYAQGFFNELRQRGEKIVEDPMMQAPVVKVKKLLDDNRVKTFNLDETDTHVRLEDLPEPGEGPEVISKEDFNAYQSLFLKSWQRREIYDVRNFRGKVYEAYIAELKAMRRKDEIQEALQLDEDERKRIEERIKVKPPEEKRYIHLQGILYTDPDDWVVWMNGQKITPGALPREVIDLTVYESYVEMRWFDEYTNKIIPLRLQTMQRFHIDTRMFLPG